MVGCYGKKIRALTTTTLPSSLRRRGRFREKGTMVRFDRDGNFIVHPLMLGWVVGVSFGVGLFFPIITEHIR